MSPRAGLRVCSCIGCPAHPTSCPRLTQGGRCPDCTRQAEQRRGTSSSRGYSGRGHRGFRLAVLDRDPICVDCQLAASTVADHWPLSRRELEARGLDPNDPAHGRGLCKRCHDRETGRSQSTGFLDPER